LSAYENVAFHEDHVDWINTKGKNGFTVICAGGLTVAARKVLLTTGLKDEIPQIEGVEAFYGCSVHHCPYCDGFENRDKPIAVYGEGEKGAGLALMMKQWSADVILCTDGPSTLSPDMQARLEEHGIVVCPERVAKLEGDQNGHLQRICFGDGSVIERTALFFSTGCMQGSDLWERLGCKRDEKGGIISNPLTEESSIPGVYVGGDASRDVLLIAVAIAEGAKAAVAINRALLQEDGLA
jgi:thioredoxin reductase